MTLGTQALEAIIDSGVSGPDAATEKYLMVDQNCEHVSLKR